MNLETLDWDQDILNLFDIPRACLPEISLLQRSLWRLATGVLANVPLAGILGDQQAALFGQACFQPGQAKNTYGTGCFMLMNTGEKPFQSKCGLITTLAYKLGNEPPRLRAGRLDRHTGALVQWLRDNLGLIASASEIEALARTVADNGGVYFVPAFSGLYAPYWRADARGIVAGLTRFANKGHIARAALEATAYQTRDVLDAMARISASISRNCASMAAWSSTNC